MKRTHMYASFAGAGLLSCAIIALAQTPPSNPNPTPPRPREPSQQPSQRPPSSAQIGYMETPRYAERLDTTLSENAIQVCADKDFKGEQTTLENVMKSHQAGTLNEFPAKFDNDATSLRWNIAPGVLVILFDDAAGKGVQLALWGKGKISDLDKCAFDNTASRWGWYDVGGGAEPRSAGAMHMPYGSQALDAPIGDDTIQMFDDQNFKNNEQKITPVSARKSGDLHKLPGDTENWLSSLRWNLPEGVVVMLSAKDNGINNIVIFGDAQYPDLGKCDFDNSASRWSWAYIGSPTKEPSGNKPREP